MSLTTITPKIAFEFTPGMWTSMIDSATPYLDNLSAISFGHGVDESSRQPRISTMSFSLENSSEAFTPGNTSSALYAQLRKGIGVRLSSIVGVTETFHFRGVVTDISMTFDDVRPAGNRVEVSCEGMLSVLAATPDYSTAIYKSNIDVDNAMAEVMTGTGTTLYSFEDSDIVLPYFIQRGAPLTDVMALAQSDLGSLVWEDGLGRLRFKKGANMVGGHGSPYATWGSTIEPETAVKPDYRNESVFAKASARVSTIAPTTDFGGASWVYSDYYGPELLAPYASRRFRGRFEQTPYFINPRQGGTFMGGFIDSGDKLYANITNVATTVTTSSAAQNPITFQPGQKIRIDTEIMQVNAITFIGNFRQVLQVTRGAFGSTADAHTAGSGPTATQIFLEPFDAKYEIIANLAVGLPALTGVPTAGSPGHAIRLAGAQAVEDLDLGARLYIAHQGSVELMALTSPPVDVGGGEYTMTVTRGVDGSSTTAKTVNATVRLVVPYYYSNIGEAIGVSSSLTETGLTDNSSVIFTAAFFNGAEIYHASKDFEVVVYNQSASPRWIRDFGVGGSSIAAAETSVNYVLEQPIPGVVGLPEGPTVAVPYGLPTKSLAKAYIAGLLVGGRSPFAWLSPTFHANADTNTTSILGANIGDLVRYTGAGTYREKIDEWFRILGISCVIDGDQGDQWHFTFVLAPSHLAVRADRSWYTTFSWQQTEGTTGLGEFDAGPPGDAGWIQDTQWRTQFPPGMVNPATVALVTADNIVTAPGVNAPNPALISLGQAHMKVVAGVTFGPAIDNAYPVNSGGVGVVFRCNSTGSERWTAYFNPSSGEVILSNSTDGVRDRKPYTMPASRKAEIAVIAQSNRIRVYVDTQAEPIIDLPNETRFNGNNYAGVGMSRTITTTGTQYPGPRWFSAQAV